MIWIGTPVDELFLDFPAKQGLHTSEESSYSISHAEATVNHVEIAWIRIALLNVRRRGMNIRRESGDHAVSIECSRYLGGRNGKDVQK